MSKEYIYLGHDNTIDRILKADDIPQDLSSVTKITMTFGDTTLESTDKASGIITWDQGGYDTGEIRMDLGAQTIDAGNYRAPIVVYDATNTDGIVWDTINVVVVDDVEAA